MFVKQCSRCGLNKGINSYYIAEGGMHSICKECRDAIFKNKSPFDI